jgi:hypothetical protein
MSNPYEMFKTDKKLETEGVILDYGSFQITVARAGGSNKKFQKALSDLAKPHTLAMKNQTMDPELADRLMVEAYADSIILNWKGVTDESGKKIPFNKANVIELFTNLPDLFSNVVEQASQFSMFHDDTVGQAEKN